MSHQLVKATAQILSATRLLAAEAEGEEGAADLKVSGLPKKFWVVIQPTAEQELENVAVEVSFAEFMDKVKNGLEQSSIVGLFKRKGDAQSKAKKLLREVKKVAKKAEEEAAEAADAQEVAEIEESQAEEAEGDLDENTGEASTADEVEEEAAEAVEETPVEGTAKAVLLLSDQVQIMKARRYLIEALEGQSDYEMEP